MMLDIKTAVGIVEEYHDCFRFEKFGDRGNNCYAPYRDDPESVNMMIAKVRNAIPKNGEMHLRLTSVLKRQMNLERMGYDYLCKVLARLLSGVESETSLLNICRLSREVRAKMKEQNLKEIISLTDVGL